MKFGGRFAVPRRTLGSLSGAVAVAISQDDGVAARSSELIATSGVKRNLATNSEEPSCLALEAVDSRQHAVSLLL